MILVTGCAGFIGFNATKYLLDQGHDVIGIDNMCNAYYDPKFKHMRLKELEPYKNFTFYGIDINDRDKLDAICGDGLEHIFHLAAHGAIPYSLKDPRQYMIDNVLGFVVILELIKKQKNFKQLVYATTSAVYGDTSQVPFKEAELDYKTVSIYGATKLCDEILAQTYHHLFDIPMTGLRYFTAYGPWGRPDMATFKFVDAIANDKPVTLYNGGHMWRDFAYIDDIVQGSCAALFSSNKEHKVYNIGYNKAIQINALVDIMEELIGKKAHRVDMPLQPGDPLKTLADVRLIEQDLGFKPQTDIRNGLSIFVSWYMDHRSSFS